MNKLHRVCDKYELIYFAHAFQSNCSHIICRVRVPTRAGSTKTEMKGIFVGAKVVQGHDWEWGGQDGGKNYALLF